MKADRILFPSLSWWLLLLVPFLFLGFFPSYFSKLFSPMNSVIHLHAVFMCIWMAIAIAQPFLIRAKKTRLHRTLGKLSYIILPLVLVTGWMMIRHGYHSAIQRELNAGTNLSAAKTEAIIEQVGDGIIIGMVYLIWLAVFYAFAVINRKRVVPHATFMFAAVLTFLGPTIDRILFQVYQYYGIGFNLFAETAVFILIDLLLIALLLYQKHKGYSIKAAGTAILIYITGQVLYFILPGTGEWSSFIAWIM